MQKINVIKRLWKFFFCGIWQILVYVKYSNEWSQTLKVKWRWKLLSCVWLFVTPWTIQSMEFSRHEYWSGLPFPSPGDLPDPGIEPAFLISPALAGEFWILLQCRRPWVWFLGQERSSWEGNHYPLQYSGLENSMDCIVHGVTERWTCLSDFHFHLD